MHALASSGLTASHGNESELPWDMRQPFDAPVGKNGLLHLGFERRGERTILASLERRTPLLAQKALYFDEALPDMACVFMIMTSGCVLGGDRLALEIDVGEGARAHVTTQAATKIHAMPENFAAQTQRLRLAKDTYLELQPDPLIPHRGSRFLTDTTIEIDPTATLYYSEILMSGRKYHHEDESFGWDFFSSMVTAVRPDRSDLFTEKFVIQPKRDHVRRLGVMGPYEVFGNAILLTPKQNSDRVLARAGAGISAEIAFGANRLPNDAGVIFKALGMESYTVRDKLHEFWDIAREIVVDCKAPDGWFWR